MQYMAEALKVFSSAGQNVFFKSCPRCRGDLLKQVDEYHKVAYHCIQCSVEVNAPQPDVRREVWFSRKEKQVLGIK